MKAPSPDTAINDVPMSVRAGNLISNWNWDGDAKPFNSFRTDAILTVGDLRDALLTKRLEPLKYRNVGNVVYRELMELAGLPLPPVRPFVRHFFKCPSCGAEHPAKPNLIKRTVKKGEPL